MILYNKTALSALQLSKKASEISDLGIEKVREELALEVSKLYFMTLTTSEQKIILEGNITKTKRLRDITKVLVDNGMALQVDYDRVNVSIENLLTQLNNVDAGLEQQLNTLKYILNIPIRDSIILTDKTELTLLEKTPMNEADFSNHIDIKLLESQKEINLLNKKIVNSGYYPSLLISGQYAFTGQRREFKNYFNDSPENL
jgi:outer membrane protein TolC